MINKILFFCIFFKIFIKIFLIKLMKNKFFILLFIGDTDSFIKVALKISRPES